MEPVNENEPPEPNRKSVGTEPEIIVIFQFDVKNSVRMIIYLYIFVTLPPFNKRFGLRHFFLESRTRNPPRSTFGAKHSCSRVTENE